MQTGAIILCGGKSSRMTLPKATLPFGEEMLLQRVVRICDSFLSPIIVVAAPEQDLPELAPGVSIARDEREGRGPLQGLAAGLSALKNQADAAYVTSCDVPFLAPAFVQALTGRLADYDIVVPFDARYHHPLAAVYRTSVLPTVQRLLAEDRMRPLFLFDAVNTLRVSTDELSEVDPELKSLMNLNRPSDYFTAMDSAGFAVPEAVRQTLETNT